MKNVLWQRQESVIATISTIHAAVTGYTTMVGTVGHQFFLDNFFLF
jgi:hypothetical protein